MLDPRASPGSGSPASPAPPAAPSWPRVESTSTPLYLFNDAAVTAPGVPPGTGCLREAVKLLLLTFLDQRVGRARHTWPRSPDAGVAVSSLSSNTCLRAPCAQ